MKASLSLAVLYMAASVSTCSMFAQRFIKLDPSYEHIKWGIEPRDHVFEFAAFTTSFDGKDDNDGDGDADAWGIPKWVAFEIKRLVTDHPLAQRPDWFTDENLHSRGIAPNDGSYHVEGTKDLAVVKSSYRYVRSHMCSKDVAERISADAAYNTHTILNAVPQLQWQNNGIWKKFEKQCTEWADQHGRIWVICGPIFFGRSPAVGLGQDDEQKAALADALFKIVIRKEADGLRTLGFVIPNVRPKEEDDFWDYLTSNDEIEMDTGLDFLSSLQGTIQHQLKNGKDQRTFW